MSTTLDSPASTLTRSGTLPSPTDDPLVIGAMVRRLLAQVELVGGVRLLGGGVSGLADFTQEDLFAQAQREAEEEEELLEALAKMGGSALIGAAHGNCEQMVDPVHDVPHTSHTLNLVEFFVVGDGYVAGKTAMRQGGRLADVAPTVLQLMGLPKPAEMTGQSLILG